ncbi:hypothetical protein IMCC21906_03101 [Spongiibacter sp. IMCC21906]|jgi:hypothetical protein|uniref:hypothetical protein n=1 Tax=Spongiibacter sp. IMCC21906 TaxID=1620392 RepID=UPI00062DD4F5|nr:hypothetical protein [Spongiibacter sp. IMCC21906]AKH70741.1 hypothetical protein IMCC21906_03101 [Spongiibacter sp. IMCC21906]
MAISNVVTLNEYRQESEQVIIDDISAQAFLFLQEQAQENKLSMRKLLMEHLLGLACVVKAVEGPEEARNWLNKISSEITRELEK